MKILKYSIVVLAFTALLSGCKSQAEMMEEHHFDNKLYINTEKAVDESLVKSGFEGSFVKKLSVQTALKADEKITGKFVVAPERMDTYKQAFNDEEAILLPDGKCVIENADVVIEKGAVASSESTVIFSNLSDLNVDSIYVMPVALVDVQGIEVLKSKTSVYFRFKGANLINVVANIAENRAYPDFNDDPAYSNMGQFTLEALVKPDKLTNGISTLMGIEGLFLLRCGDSAPKDQIQIATSNGNFTNEDFDIVAGQWNHVAVTFDNGSLKGYINGSLKLDEHTPFTTVTFSAKHHNEEDGRRVFWIGYSYEHNRYFDGCISEVRIWNKALSKDEINSNNHFYEIDPVPAELLSYWRFNEGSGNIIKDWGTMGYDLTVDKAPNWINVVLPEKK